MRPIKIAAWIATGVFSIVFISRMVALSNIQTKYGSPVLSPPYVLGILLACALIPGVLWIIVALTNQRLSPKSNNYTDLGKWYDNNWNIALCFIFWPLGLFLLIRKLIIQNRPKNKNDKSIEDKLELLLDLKNQGLITNDELEKRKNELIKLNENEIKRQKLIDAMNMGVISKEEFESKIDKL